MLQATDGEDDPHDGHHVDVLGEAGGEDVQQPLHGVVQRGLRRLDGIRLHGSNRLQQLVNQVLQTPNTCTVRRQPQAQTHAHHTTTGTNTCTPNNHRHTHMHQTTTGTHTCTKQPQAHTHAHQTTTGTHTCTPNNHRRTHMYTKQPQAHTHAHQTTTGAHTCTPNNHRRTHMHTKQPHARPARTGLGLAAHSYRNSLRAFHACS